MSADWFDHHCQCQRETVVTSYLHVSTGRSPQGPNQNKLRRHNITDVQDMSPNTSIKCKEDSRTRGSVVVTIIHIYVGHKRGFLTSEDIQGSRQDKANMQRT